MTELTSMSALDQARLIREKKISAEELLNETLAQVKKVDGRPGSLEEYIEQPEDKEKVHAFILITEESAREKARAVDRKVAAGGGIGTLSRCSLFGERCLLHKRDSNDGRIQDSGWVSSSLHFHSYSTVGTGGCGAVRKSEFG